MWRTSGGEEAEGSQIEGGGTHCESTKLWGGLDVVAVCHWLEVFGEIMYVESQDERPKGWFLHVVDGTLLTLMSLKGGADAELNEQGSYASARISSQARE